MTELKTNADSIGQIQIADEVIAVIAGTAAMEINGVVATSSNFTGDLAGMLGKKNFSKGVKVEVVENEVSIDISILVKFGYKIQEVASEVQKKVKIAIETMTGLDAVEINVIVTGVNFEKEKQKDASDNQN